METAFVLGGGGVLGAHERLSRGLGRGDALVIFPEGSTGRRGGGGEASGG